MFLKISLMTLSLFAGSMIAFQAPINAKLGSVTGGPLIAAFFSFLIGTVALGALLALTGNIPKFENLIKTESWMWVGGLLGAILVTASIYIIPHLGSALMISLFIAGQILGALLIDKTGFLLPEAIEIDWQRFLALLLILAGAALLSKAK